MNNNKKHIISLAICALFAAGAAQAQILPNLGSLTGHNGNSGSSVVGVNILGFGSSQQSFNVVTLGNHNYFGEITPGLLSTGHAPLSGLEPLAGKNSAIAVSALGGLDTGNGQLVGINALGDNYSGNGKLLGVGALNSGDTLHLKIGQHKIANLQSPQESLLNLNSDPFLGVTSFTSTLYNQTGELPGLQKASTLLPTSTLARQSIAGVNLLGSDTVGTPFKNLLGATVLGSNNTANQNTINAGALNQNNTANNGLIGAAVLNKNNAANQNGLVGAGVLNGNQVANNSPVAAGVLNQNNVANNVLVGVGALNQNNSANAKAVGVGAFSGNNTANNGLVSVAAVSGNNSAQGKMVGAGALNGDNSSGGMVNVGALNGSKTAASQTGLVGVGALNQSNTSGNMVNVGALNRSSSKSVATNDPTSVNIGVLNQQTVNQTAPTNTPVVNNLNVSCTNAANHSNNDASKETNCNKSVNLATN